MNQSPKQLMRRARRLFDVDYVPASVNRHNRREWVRSVLRLDDKWIVARPVTRAPQEAA